MKKTLLLLAACAFMAQSAIAEDALAPSSTWDNWYIGIEGGASSKIMHNAIFKNANPQFGLRIGREFTPVFGFLLEGQGFARTRNVVQSHTFVKAIDVHLLGKVNLSNWFGGYKGQPRCFEVSLIAGPGIAHAIGQNSKDATVNDIIGKAGVNLAFNLGKQRAWQFFLEPAVGATLNRTHRMNVHKDDLYAQMLMGFNYKFGNSNGTHNFATVQVRDQNEIDQLNARINDLRATNDKKDNQLKADAATIAQLKADLEAAKNQKPTVIQNVVKNTTNVLQPTVVFGQGKKTVDAAQLANVAMVAKYMKNHPKSRILIKGYASPEGNPEINQRISEQRAQAVKDALVKRYGISADRLEIKGMGATDELFDELDFNRVATFTDMTK